MKIRKLLLAAVFCVVFAAFGLTANAEVSAGYVTSSGDIEVGDSFDMTVTVTADEDIGLVQGVFGYDDAKLEYIAGEPTGGGGSLVITGFPDQLSDSWSFTMTFRAKAGGSADISLTGVSVYSTLQELIGSPELSGSITVTDPMAVTEPEEPDEPDDDPSDLDIIIDDQPHGYLKSLSVSEGKLSPAFDRETFDYSVKVSAETDSVTVYAAAENPVDYLEYTSDNKLDFGENTIDVAVIGEDGSYSIYTLTVTRPEPEKPESDAAIDSGSDDTAAELSDSSPDESIEDKSSSSSPSSKSQKKTDGAKDIKRVLNPALVVVLLVLVIALFILLHWVGTKIKGDKDR